MFKIHSITGRVFVGKMVGLLVGLIVMLVMPSFNMPVFSRFGLGTLIMFVLMGAMTGLVGIFDRHPVFNFKMAWWLSGPLVGALFMLMFILFTYETLDVVMQSSLVSWMGIKSPYWALIDGLFIGGMMGFLESSLAGEGKKLPLK